ncbi:substrate-binding domain-containing protein [Cellulomonas marina]|uniref:LacI family transcriptional regulator n=1 Tax=Cellulomonas marina TaxID=988821 RepID=A0A1I1A8B6_9CELL|nr:substrate-binding domain-containing protein [Cellulomonas marina]GIG29600.1 hypothetical protein Cma02nite_22000 [Cellulomonas marina]SFB33646.1 LacI family transcriptional regulator [Cellulomonas marina]
MVVAPGLVGHAATYGVDDGVAAGERLFALPPDRRPTAVFAANDNLAVGVMSAAHRAGLVPGQDVAVVGYNDIPLARRMPVPLSSVLVPYDLIASTALDMLVGGATPRIERTMPTLLPRASSGGPVGAPGA